MTPRERFDKYQRLAFFALRKVWPHQSQQRRAALANGMEYEDFDQIALTELWRCCLQHDEEQGERAFRTFVIKSIRFAVLDAMRRKGALIRYPDEIKERLQVVYFESHASETNRGGDVVDLHSLVESTVNIERQVLLKLTLEEKLSSLNPDERFIILCKLASQTQKDIELKGYSVARQNYFIRKAYAKLGIKRDRFGRKELFISLYNAGKTKEEIMKAMQIDKYAFWSYRKTYRNQLKENVAIC